MKNIFTALDTTFGFFIGLNIIDFMQINEFDISQLSNLIDAKVKMVMAILGIVYYVMNGIHKFKMNKEELREKRTKNKMLEDDLELKEFKTDKEIKNNKYEE